MIYDKNYFLSRCTGFEDFLKHKADVLNNRLRRVLQVVGPVKGTSILDLGSGRGEMLYQCARRGCKIVGVDSSLDAISLSRQIIKKLAKSAKKNVVLIHEDINNVIFPKESFDAILMSDIVEHLDDGDLKEIFNKCNKWLKSGGRLIIHTSPNKLYILYIYPILRIMSLFWGKDLGPVRKNYPDSLEHPNEQTPMSLKKLLKENFEAKIWCENMNAAGFVNKIPLLNLFAVSIFAEARKKS